MHTLRFALTAALLHMPLLAQIPSVVIDPSTVQTPAAPLQAAADAIAQLVREGRDRTGTLFVYFAGHGFHLEDIQQGTDVLAAADFCSPETSGNACLRLDELQSGLRRWLGSGESSDHFYFIDACRRPKGQTLMAEKA